jgi:histidine triad (HIT) family protein
MDCLFCKIANHEISSKVVYEDHDLIAFHDINPKAPVHILVVPKKHIGSIALLKDEDILIIGKLITKASQLAKEQGISEKGFRLIFNTGADSGQEIDHIHLHLLGGKSLGPMITS